MADSARDFAMFTLSCSISLTGDPAGEGFFFNGDNDFKNAGIGINQNDNYMSLFIADFRAEIDLRAVKARYFRLSPQYQGWGHLWGEVEFWEIAN